MNWVSKSLAAVSIIFLSTTTTFVFATFVDQCTRHNLDRDFEQVNNFINSKRNIKDIDKGDALEFEGDVRAEWLDRHERDRFGNQLRGGGFNERTHTLRPPFNNYDAQMNIYVDYRHERAWGSAQIQFVEAYGVDIHSQNCDLNPAGSFGSGFCHDVCLKKLLWGWNIFKAKTSILDVEVGRRQLYKVLDSRIQFHARVDGILFQYSDRFWEHSDLYCIIFPFVVDNRVDHYSWAGEISFYDLERFDILYSYIDWTHDGRNACGIRNARGWRFRNSQISLAYNFPEDVIKRKMRLYGAFLINHAAKRLDRFPGFHTRSKANIGWYAGFIIGDVQKKGDWSFDANYQYVQAQAIADCDIHGIGRGNVLRESFTSNMRGKANYKGCSFEFLYALLDDFSIDTVYEFSTAANNNIGGSHYYSKVEIDFIYNF